MGSDNEIIRFGVAIIESIPDGEMHTGRMIYEDIMLPKRYADDTLFYDYYTAKTVSEFEDAVHTIINKHQDNEMLALHVEAHGCEDGVSLASGELLDWKGFLNLCRDLNNELNGLLCVTTALCYSISLMAAIDPANRAPFKAVVITRRPVIANEILKGYTAYFSIYRNILDIGPAKEAMRKVVNSGDEASSPFEMITAEWLFDQITNPDRDPDAFMHIVNKWFCIKKSEDSTYTRERVESEIRSLFENLVKNGRDFFLYKDIFQG